MKHKRSVISIGMAALVLVSLCAVVSSSGVMAAESRTNVQVPATVGADLGSAPAAAIFKDPAAESNYEPLVFVRGSEDGQPYVVDAYNTAPWVWTPLGGLIAEAPTAASGGPQHMIVTVRGMNGAIYWKETTNHGATWSPSDTGWYKVPTGVVLPGTSPAVYAVSESSIGWLVCGMDHQLYAMYYDGMNYQGWTKLGGYVTASPAVVTRGTSVDVYVRGNNGADGHIYQKSFVNGAWQTTYAERTTATNVKEGTAPTATSSLTTREDLFWVGSDDKLYQTTWPKDGDTSKWTDATTVATTGTTITSSPSAAAGTDSSRLDIELLFRGSGGDLWGVAYYYSEGTDTSIWHDAFDAGDGP